MSVTLIPLKNEPSTEMEEERDITNIVLVGYIGTGKTTVCARLAEVPQKVEFAGRATLLLT